MLPLRPGEGGSGIKDACEPHRLLYVQKPPLYGGDVRELQERLRELGLYEGPVTGFYTDLTAEAVRNLQKRNGEPPDGVFRPSYWVWLGKKENLHPRGWLSLSGASPGEVRLEVFLDRLELRIYRGEKLIGSFPVATGSPETPTPPGEWRVREKMIDPGGPFGTRWIGLDAVGGSYGIHGTDRPWSIGQMVSNGCVRMFNEDVEKVFDLVQPGTLVVIHGALPSRWPLPLERGAVGLSVVALQKLLREQGFPAGRADGRFGPETERAVRRLESFYGLQPDGRVGEVLHFLLTSPPGRPPDGTLQADRGTSRLIPVSRNSHPPGRKIRLVYWDRDWPSLLPGVRYEEWLSSLLRRFMELHPEVEVEYRLLPWGTPWPGTVATRLQFIANRGYSLDLPGTVAARLQFNANRDLSLDLPGTVATRLQDRRDAEGRLPDVLAVPPGEEPPREGVAIPPPDRGSYLGPALGSQRERGFPWWSAAVPLLLRPGEGFFPPGRWEDLALWPEGSFVLTDPPPLETDWSDFLPQLERVRATGVLSWSGGPVREETVAELLSGGRVLMLGTSSPFLVWRLSLSGQLQPIPWPGQGLPLLSSRLHVFSHGDRERLKMALELGRFLSSQPPPWVLPGSAFLPAHLDAWRNWARASLDSPFGRAFLATFPHWKPGRADLARRAEPWLGAFFSGKISAGEAARKITGPPPEIPFWRRFLPF